MTDLKAIAEKLINPESIMEYGGLAEMHSDTLAKAYLALLRTRAAEVMIENGIVSYNGQPIADFSELPKTNEKLFNRLEVLEAEAVRLVTALKLNGGHSDACYCCRGWRLANREAFAACPESVKLSEKERG